MTSSGSKATATLSGSPALAMRSASSRVWSVITRIVGVSRTAVSPREAGSISVSTVTNLPPSFESIAQVDGHGVDGHERHEEHDDRRRGDLAELGVGTLGPGVDDRRQAREGPAELVEEALRRIAKRPDDGADDDERRRLPQRPG